MGLNPFVKFSDAFPHKEDVTETKISDIVHEPIEVKKEESEHAKILREHGGQESNIPINHHYWRIRP